MNTVNWKKEAQKNAAAAGEFRIKLCCRLDELKTRYRNLQKEAIDSNDYNQMYCILNRLSFINEEISWLEGVLNGKG